MKQISCLAWDQLMPRVFKKHISDLDPNQNFLLLFLEKIQFYNTNLGIMSGKKSKQTPRPSANRKEIGNKNKNPTKKSTLDWLRLSFQLRRSKIFVANAIGTRQSNKMSHFHRISSLRSAPKIRPWSLLWMDVAAFSSWVLLFLTLLRHQKPIIHSLKSVPRSNEMD